MNEDKIVLVREIKIRMEIIKDLLRNITSLVMQIVGESKTK